MSPFTFESHVVIDRNGCPVGTRCLSTQSHAGAKQVTKEQPSWGALVPVPTCHSGSARGYKMAHPWQAINRGEFDEAGDCACDRRGDT